MVRSNQQKNTVRVAYAGLQKQLSAGLNSTRTVLAHPTAKGSATESRWLEMLKQHLPMRYQADSAFIIDSDGNQSDQIDVVIYDQQYSPIFYNSDSEIIIPAESVYGVFEVKQALNLENLTYASEKIASVRRLSRSSAAVFHIGAAQPAREPPPIVGGILTTDSDWHPALGEPFSTAVSSLEHEAEIDLGCVVDGGAFEVSRRADTVYVDVSAPEGALAFFFLRLIRRLQKAGTVPAIDFDKYLAAFDR